ncbi:MAG: hypothetical protein NTV34_12760 [Proteobacteria bacterium]|nr:hypothetical protein [Pseudomonadota bacterium]
MAKVGFWTMICLGFALYSCKATKSVDAEQYSLATSPGSKPSAAALLNKSKSLNLRCKQVEAFRGLDKNEFNLHKEGTKYTVVQNEIPYDAFLSKETPAGDIQFQFKRLKNTYIYLLMSSSACQNDTTKVVLRTSPWDREVEAPTASVILDSTNPEYKKSMDATYICTETGLFGLPSCNRGLVHDILSRYNE